MSDKLIQTDGGEKPDWGNVAGSSAKKPAGGSPAPQASKEIRLSEVQNAGGIVCPNCHCRRLVDPDGPGWEKARMAVAKTQHGQGSTRRIRKCGHCGTTVTTNETIVGEPRIRDEEKEIRLSDY